MSAIRTQNGAGSSMECAARSVRGAIDVPDNSSECILERCRLLLTEMMKENEIQMNGVAAILFTATRDLDAVYPAQAAREMGFTAASLMCMQEMYVIGSMEKCLRVMILWNTQKPQYDMKHVYLGKAIQLRTDLIEDNK